VHCFYIYCPIKLFDFVEIVVGSLIFCIILVPRDKNLKFNTNFNEFHQQLPEKSTNYRAEM
jgi:hypothetical protein